VLKQTRNP